MTAAVMQLALFGEDTDAATPEPVRRVWRPLQQPLTAKTVARFWAKVVKSPSCFYFTGALSHPDGYGRFTFTDGGTPRTLSAHRFALLLEYGDLGDGIVGEHDCDETLCVRVADGHLKRGTQSANLFTRLRSGGTSDRHLQAGIHADGTGARSRSAPHSPAATTNTECLHHSPATASTRTHHRPCSEASPPTELSEARGTHRSIRPRAAPPQR